MIHHRSITQNRSTLVIVGLVAVLGLMALAINFNGQSIGADAALNAPAAGNSVSQQSIEAYSARWAGLAETYTLEQVKRAQAVQLQYLAGSTARAVEVYGVRWTGLAEAYALEQAKRAQAVQLQYLAGNTARAVEAYGGRWAGLAETYAPVEAYGARWQGLADAYRQRAIDAYAARWQGLAETYANK
jgi:hypothetical protein